MEYMIYGIIAVQILQAIAFFKFRNDTLKVAKKLANIQIYFLKDIIKLEEKMRDKENEKE